MRFCSLKFSTNNTSTNRWTTLAIKSSHEKKLIIYACHDIMCDPPHVISCLLCHIVVNRNVGSSCMYGPETEQEGVKFHNRFLLTADRRLRFRFMCRMWCMRLKYLKTFAGKVHAELTRIVLFVSNDLIVIRFLGVDSLSVVPLFPLYSYFINKHDEM